MAVTFVTNSDSALYFLWTSNFQGQHAFRFMFTRPTFFHQNFKRERKSWLQNKMLDGRLARVARSHRIGSSRRHRRLEYSESAYFPLDERFYSSPFHVRAGIAQREINLSYLYDGLSDCLRWSPNSLLSCGVSQVQSIALQCLLWPSREPVSISNFSFQFKFSLPVCR